MAYMYLYTGSHDEGVENAFDIHNYEQMSRKEHLYSNTTI